MQKMHSVPAARVDVNLQEGWQQEGTTQHHQNQPALCMLDNKASPQAPVFLSISYLRNFLSAPPVMLFGNAGSWFTGRERKQSWQSSTSSHGDTWAGDLQGLHVVGTQSTVVAVGDTVSATDLLQDEGAGGNGFTILTIAQVLGAVKLGRKQ